jgi:predicted dehydrogenase
MAAVNRRQFLEQSGTAAGVAVGLSALEYAGAAAANDTLTVAVMGVRGRGRELAAHFAKQPDVEVAALCEVDPKVVPAALKGVADHQRREPPVVTDVRRLLDDAAIDALIIAAPNHWHALATVWGCQAGKDVYVEKPVSHNIVEGRRMVEAARRYERVVQSGTQRRSSPHWRRATELVRAGRIGHVATARAWIIRPRQPIGRMADAPVPEGVDYGLWLGPAALRPFNPNRFHYNWHWFWEYGNGELGNNGVHMLDMARLGLGAEAPAVVSSAGGLFVFDDDRETPDTQVVTYEFPGCVLIWEHRQWSSYGLLNEEGHVRIGGGVVFYGSEGTLHVNDQGWQIVVKGETVEQGPGADDSIPLIRNFIDCVKSRERPDADIEDGHRSTSLCHLGNISQRLGRRLRWDGERERFPDDDEANRLLTRDYRRPYVLPEQV